MQQHTLPVITKQRFNQSTSYYDLSNDSNLMKKAVIYGLLIGDCLGSTSEFMIPKDVGKFLIEKTEKKGWPYELSENNIWHKGESTDDGDVCLNLTIT